MYRIHIRGQLEYDTNHDGDVSSAYDIGDIPRPRSCSNVSSTPHILTFGHIDSQLQVPIHQQLRMGNSYNYYDYKLFGYL